jgi:hypothetical protein
MKLETVRVEETPIGYVYEIDMIVDDNGHVLSMAADKFVR